MLPTKPNLEVINLHILAQKIKITAVLTSEEAIKNTLIGAKLERLSTEGCRAERADNKLSE